MRGATWIITLFVIGTAEAIDAQEVCNLVRMEVGSVHACVAGQGPMTVVLAAGAGQTLRTWRDLVPQLSAAARVITSDRPGLGQSPPGPPPRTPTRIAVELHGLLQKLEIDGPVLLVGHSMGGLHMLRYAALYPEQVVGVVLLDTPPRGFEEARMSLLSPQERVERQRILAEGLTGVPDAVRLEREGSRDPEEWRFSAFPRTLPLRVVVADSQDFGNHGSRDAHRRLWVQESRSWTELSTSASLTIAKGSGHMVHHDRRELVVEIILKMINELGDSGAPQGPQPNKELLLTGSASWSGSRILEPLATFGNRDL